MPTATSAITTHSPLHLKSIRPRSYYENVFNDEKDDMAVSSPESTLMIQLKDILPPSSQAMTGNYQSGIFLSTEGKVEIILPTKPSTYTTDLRRRRKSVTRIESAYPRWNSDPHRDSLRALLLAQEAYYESLYDAVFLLIQSAREISTSEAATGALNVKESKYEESKDWRWNEGWYWNQAGKGERKLFNMKSSDQGVQGHKSKVWTFEGSNRKAFLMECAEGRKRDEMVEMESFCERCDILNAEGVFGGKACIWLVCEERFEGVVLVAEN